MLQRLRQDWHWKKQAPRPHFISRARARAFMRQGHGLLQLRQCARNA
jgi:hypothetical protein